MRVVVNRESAGRFKTGVGYYTAELLRCLRQQAGSDRIDGYPHPWVWRARELWARARPGLEGRVGDRLSAQANEPASPTPSGMLSAARTGVVTYLRGWGKYLLDRHHDAHFASRAYDLYHEPNHIPLPSDLPTVVTFHDLSVLLHPEWHPTERVAFFEENFYPGLKRCSHALTVSEFTRQEVIRTLGLAPERVTSVHNGIRPGLRPLPPARVAAVLRQLQLPPRYLLYLGTIEPRKNVLALLRSYCRLPAALRERWPLLLVGGWGWKTTEVAAYYQDEARHRGVIHVGYLAEEHIAAIYNGARALVYPSLYEGFGLPPVEMMACGGAVLASTAAALVETVGARAHLIHPEDEDGWRDALQRVITDDDWWQRLRDGTQELARPFTWDRCAAETLQVYRALCGPRAAHPSLAA
jgi:glycosyltransferase involved in cell wall biosynthesis